MDILTLLALAIGPGLAIAYYVYMRDKFEKEPRSLLFRSFFLGVLSLFLAVFFEVLLGSYMVLDPMDFVSVAIFSFVVVGLSEEFSKYVFLRWFAYNKKAFNEPFDGIVYSVMIGMGFATFENLNYVLGDGGGLGVAFLRMFTAVPAHAIFGIMMGYFVGLSKFTDSKKGFWLRMTGLGTAVFFHGAYDFFLFQQNSLGLYFGSVLTVIIGFVLSKKALRMHANNSPFKKA